MAKDLPRFASAERRALLDALGLDLKQLDRRTRAAIEALSEEVLALRDGSAALKDKPRARGIAPRNPRAMRIAHAPAVVVIRLG